MEFQNHIIFLYINMSILYRYAYMPLGLHAHICPLTLYAMVCHNLQPLTDGLWLRDTGSPWPYINLHMNSTQHNSISPPPTICTYVALHSDTVHLTWQLYTYSTIVAHASSLRPTNNLLLNILVNHYHSIVIRITS